MKLKILILLLTSLTIFAQGNQKPVITFDTIADLVRLGNPRNTAGNVVEVLGYHSRNDGGGGTFAATNTITSTNIGTRIGSPVTGWSWERIYDGPLNIRQWGASSGGDITLTLSNVPSATPVVIPVKGSPFTMTSLTNTSKDLILLFEDGAKIVHSAAAPGNMIHLSGGSVTISGRGILDGNKANQTTNTFYSLIYGRNPNIQDVTFTNWVRAAYHDFQTTTRAEFRNVKAYNGFHVLTNDTSKTTTAFSIAPGQAGFRPFINMENIYMENEAKQDAYRLPGGIILAGADSNGSELRVSLKGIRGVNVGDDTALSGGGASHIGTAFLDMYEDFESLHIEDFYVTNTHYMGLKIQNAGKVKIKDGYIHSKAVTAMGYAPGERLQTNPYWTADFSNITIDMAGRTNGNGWVIGAADASGFRTLTASKITITNTHKPIIIDGIVDSTGLSDTYNSRLTFSELDLNTTNHNAILAYGFQGELIINDSYIAGLSGLKMNETNDLARVQLNGNRFKSSSGVAVWVNGVAELVGSGNTTESSSGQAVNFAADAAGNHILELRWDESNINRGGSESVTTADIDAGYFASGGVVTYFPTGATMTRGNGSATYLQDWRFDLGSAVIGMRWRNNASGGAMINSIFTESAAGSWSVYDDTYSDADRAGRSVLRNDVGSGLDIWSIFGNLRAKAGNVLSGTWTGTNYSQVGNISVGGRFEGNVLATGSSTARSLQDRFGEVFNVLDYGAIPGDGIDDSAAMQLAANATAGRSNSVVYIPPGVYTNTSTVIFSNQVTILGYGATIRAGGSATRVIQLGADGLSDFDRWNLFSIRGVKFVFGANTVSNSVYVANKISRAVIADCDFRNTFVATGASEVYFAGDNWESVVQDCWFYPAGSVGSRAITTNPDTLTGNPSPNSNIKITGNTFSGLAALVEPAVDVSNTRILIANNNFNRNHAIHFRSATNGVGSFINAVVNNTFEAGNDSTNDAIITYEGQLVGARLEGNYFNPNNRQISGTDYNGLVLRPSDGTSFTTGLQYIHNTHVYFTNEFPIFQNIADTKGVHYGNYETPVTSTNDYGAELVEMTQVDNLGSLRRNIAFTSGVATLVGGTVTVSTAAVTANSLIFLTVNTAGGTVGSPYVSARVAGTSFDITSTSGTDTSTVAWMLFEP